MLLVNVGERSKQQEVTCSFRGGSRRVQPFRALACAIVGFVEQTEQEVEPPLDRESVAENGISRWPGFHLLRAPQPFNQLLAGTHTLFEQAACLIQMKD